jgi:hypothetical protein
VTSAPPAIFELRLQRGFTRVRWPLLWVGVLLLAASIAGAYFSPNDFFRSYLVGYLYLISLTLGSMAYLMVHHLTGGAWGVMTRRSLEAATRTLPLVAILFIPIGCGMSNLYSWARPEVVLHDHILQHRSGYTNPEFFLARAAIYLVVWMVFAFFLNRWSAEQDRNPSGRHGRLMKLSTGGLIFYLFSITFAAIDWAESLQTEWASSIWGLMFIAAEGFTALAFLIVVMAVLSRREPMSRVLKPSHFHDLGKMLLANLMVWAYFVFVQYLIVWSSNLTHEIHYYLPRTGTSWGWLGVALIVVQFLIPVLLLLNRPLKRNAYLLAGVAVIVLVMRYFDLIWIVLPGYYTHGFRIQWMQVLTPLGLICIWLWAFLRELPRFPLIPVNAPELEEALAHETK